MSIEKKIKRGWRWIAQNGGGVSIEGRGGQTFGTQCSYFFKGKTIGKTKMEL